jgi:uncharacterized membrane protein YccC
MSLIDLIPGVPQLKIIAMVGGVLVAGLTGAYMAHRWDAGTIAEARLETAKVREEYASYAASTAANAAKATANALDQQIRLQEANNALEAQLQESQNVAASKSKALSDILASAKASDTRPLGASVMAYLERLRGTKASGSDGR